MTHSGHRSWHPSPKVPAGQEMLQLPIQRGKHQRPASRSAGPEAGARSRPYLGPVQPGSQRGQAPVSGSQASPCRQRGQRRRQRSPCEPGGQRCWQRVPFQPGWQPGQSPSTAEQGWPSLQRPQLHGQRGGEALTRTTDPPNRRFHPETVPSISWDQGGTAHSA